MIHILIFLIDQFIFTSRFRTDWLRVRYTITELTAEQLHRAITKPDREIKKGREQRYDSDECSGKEA